MLRYRNMPKEGLDTNALTPFPNECDLREFCPDLIPIEETRRRAWEYVRNPWPILGYD